ncbi:hypothetical protein BH09BAC5_BH09BAC5_16270 [soil metagenome]
MKKIFTLFVGAFFVFNVNAQWDTLTTNTNTNFYSIAFSSNLNGVAVGYDTDTLEGKIFRTTDGGQNWSVSHIGTSSKNSVCFSDAMHAWAAGDNGVIKKSSDGGGLWSFSAVGTKNFYSIYFANDTVGYVGGENGVLYRTSDLGASWDTLDSQTNLAIRDIYFSDDLKGWIVCDGGYIASTTDGGQTWTAHPQPYYGFMQCKSIGFAGTSGNGFVVGNDGDIVSTNDAGSNWNWFTLNSSEQLNCVRFSNSLAGIVVGNNGLIERTYVGGTNWANESMSYVTENLNHICFASDSVAYICGNNGRILKSNIDISSVHSQPEFVMNANAFPNPFENELSVKINLENASQVELSILDISGRVVFNNNYGELNAGEQIIRPEGIQDLVSGIYVVRITTENGSVSLPVIRN